MHELGVVFHVIDQIKELSVENELTHVENVTLQLGEVSTVIPEYLEDVWKWAVEREELTKGCTLVIEPIKAITYCEDCKQTYSCLLYTSPSPRDRG